MSATHTETLKLIISADGKLVGTELGATERAVKKTTRTIQGYFSKMGDGITQKLKGIATNPLAIMGGMAGIAMAAKDLMEYQDKLSTLKINARMSSKEIMGLSDSIYQMSYTTGQSRNDIINSMNDQFNRIGDWGFVKDNIKTVAEVSSAMGSSMLETSRIIESFKNSMGTTGTEARKLFDVMGRMGQQGNMPFAEQAQVAERLFGAPTKMLHLQGQNITDYMAFIQRARTMYSSTDETGTGVERVMARMAEKKKEVSRLVGFQAFDKNGAIIDFKKTIEALAKLDMSKLSRVFNEHAKLFQAFTPGQGRDLYEGLIKGGTEAGFVAEALAEKQNDAKFQMNALTNAAQQFADVGLSPVLASITDQIKGMTSNPEKMKEFSQSLKDIASGLGTIASVVGPVIGGVGKYLGMVTKGGTSTVDETKKTLLTSPMFALRSFLNLKRGWKAFSIAKEMSPEETQDFNNNGEKGSIFNYPQRLIDFHEKYQSGKAEKSTSTPINNNIAITLNIDKNGNLTADTKGDATATVKHGNRGEQGRIP